jgi:hypothetical protein
VSRDDRIELRDLPPVEPLAHWPERLSMTLARWLDRCPRAAYLYVKTGGGAPTHQMDRGSLAHEALARMMVDWLGAAATAEQAGAVGEDFTAEEIAAYTAEAGGYAGRSDEEVSSLTAGLVAAVAGEHPEWEVSHEEKDVARLCVFHGALGLDVNPEHVVAIERKFVLELECGWTISGKVDLASMPENERGQVDDYKTSLYVPPKSEWDPFQQKMYAVFVVWGRPVVREECPYGLRVGRPGDERPVRNAHKHCAHCGGRGYVEHLEEPVGGHLTHVTGRELYPRKDPRKRLDGTLWRNEHTWSRMELLEFLADLNAIGERLSERLETWKFPARYGSWCSECPDEDACPIPRGYRRFAGHIKTEEQATEAWAWAQRMKDKVSDTEKDVKGFVAGQDIEIVTGDFTWSFRTSETRALKKRSGRADWDGLQDAITSADEPLDLAASGWLKTDKRTEFKKSKRPADGVGDNETEVTTDGVRGSERAGGGSGAAGPAQGAGGSGGAERSRDGGAGRGGNRRGGSSDAELDDRYGADAPY